VSLYKFQQDAMTTQIEQNQDDGEGWMRLPEIMRRTGLSKSEIYRRMSADRFPKSLKLSPRVAVWPKLAVLEFIRAPFLDNSCRELL